MKESATRQIDLSDHSIEDLDRLIAFFYMGDYREEELATTDELPSAPSFQQDTSNPSDDPMQISKDITVLKPSKAITNITMYAMGDRYNVGALKELARKKFSALRSAEWFDELPTVAEQIYTTTPENDRGLRDILQKACVRHAEALTQDETTCETALKVPQFALDLCRSIWKECRERVMHAEIEKMTAELKVMEQNSQIQRATADVRASQMKLARVVEFVNTLDECRHCGESFPATLDPIREFARSPIFVRCSKCQTKHKAP
jgi:hypothetical protein